MKGGVTRRMFVYVWACVCARARARTPHDRALLLEQLLRELFRARFARPVCVVCVVCVGVSSEMVFL
jgi:hypothetical protein